MHLLEGPDLGHSMIYYDGKVEKKRYMKKRKSPAPEGFEPLDLSTAALQTLPLMTAWFFSDSLDAMTTPASSRSYPGPTSA